MPFSNRDPELHFNLYTRRDDPTDDIDCWAFGAVDLLRILDGEFATDLRVAAYGEGADGSPDTSKHLFTLNPEEVLSLAALTPMQRQALAKLLP